MPDQGVIEGDCRATLAAIPEGSVHCVVTSPPYWSLRVYEGVEPSWWGGDATCEHEPGEPLTMHKGGPHGNGVRLAGGRSVVEAQAKTKTIDCGSYCRCGAWHGLLGLEPHPEQFVANIVEVFRAVWRVLRDDGTLWLNLGSSYAGGGGFCATAPSSADTKSGKYGLQGALKSGGCPTGGRFKPKDLIPIPWMVALALIDDGWYLRSAMPWVRRSAMPESVTDRPSSAVEYVFLLAKQPRYFFDCEAVRQRLATPPHAPGNAERSTGFGQDFGDGRESAVWGTSAGRNLRNSDFWFESVRRPHGLVMVGDDPVGLDITSEALKLKHFAAFPRRFVATCLKAGVSARGVCPACGAPWVRVLTKERVKTRPGTDTKVSVGLTGGPYCPPGQAAHSNAPALTEGNRDPGRHVTESRTVGWKPSCECGRGETWKDGKPTGQAFPMPAEPMPATVLDPFTGSGTVGVVCKQMGLNFIGCEASAAYAEMARRRIANPEPEPEPDDVPGQLELFPAESGTNPTGE